MTGIAVLSSSHHGYRHELERRGVQVVAAGNDPAAMTLSEVVLADPYLIARCELSDVRWVQSTWAGVDAVDWNRVPPDLVVTGLPGVFGRQMREFVFAHLLASTQRTDHRPTSWDPTPPGSLRGMRLGLLGAGSIAGAVAETAEAFDMTVTGCSRSGRPDARYAKVWPVELIDEFVRELDHLVAILPATRATRRLVDRRLLECLPSGATFTNVGRGSTVVTDDVVTAAASGHLSRVVLDVTDPEPLPPDHPAWTKPNIHITGHTAAISHPVDVVDRFLDNLTRYQSGDELIGVIDRSLGY